jgi:hypothetical protein
VAHPVAAALPVGAVGVGVTASAAVVRDPARATAGAAGETGWARAAAGVA